MTYTPPAGNASHFVTTGHSPVSAGAIGLVLPGASYSAPVGNAVAFQFPEEYSAPAGTVSNFTVLAATEFVGTGAVTVGITASGVGEYQEIVVIGEGLIHTDVVALGVGVVGVTGNGTATVASAIASGSGARGVAGQGIVVFDQFSATGAGVVERFELKGEVRQAGVLINRRVRAYLRDTGNLVNEGDTVAGRFCLHTGFTPAEYYVIPIDLSNDAADWMPPCANRLLSVLAMDA